MTGRYEYFINLEPQAWQRVKRSRTGIAYVPSETRVFKSAFGKLSKQKCSQPLEGPLHLTVVFFLKPLKRKKKGQELPCVRPDLDNFVKAVKDGGNGVLWNDDSQVCLLTTGKYYAESVDKVGIFVRLETMTDDRPFNWLRAR